MIYCYATVTFSSRRIETLTYENVTVRFLTADTHPDHDSICKFRRKSNVVKTASPNSPRLKKSSKNGPKNAFLKQAEYQATLAVREEEEKTTGRKPHDKEPQPPQEGPRPKDPYNFTDPESRIKKPGDGFQQYHNVQAAVDTRTMLILDLLVCDVPNDKEQLEPVFGILKEGSRLPEIFGERERKSEHRMGPREPECEHQATPQTRDDLRTAGSRCSVLRFW